MMMMTIAIITAAQSASSPSLNYSDNKTTLVQ